MSEPYLEKRAADARRMEQANRLTADAIRSAIAALPLQPGSRGCDLACGLGFHAHWLAEAIGPGGFVTGLDLSADFLQRAQRMAAGDVRNRQQFVRGDATCLPFRPASFDWMWCADILYPGPAEEGFAFDDPVPALRSLALLVKPGGFLALAFWSAHRLLPGYPMLEARLNATPASHHPFTATADAEMHFSRALGWLRNAGFAEPTAHSHTADIRAPLDGETRAAVRSMAHMWWDRGLADVSVGDRDTFRALLADDSPDCLLDLPDYHGMITYTVFRGWVR